MPAEDNQYRNSMGSAYFDETKGAVVLTFVGRRHGKLYRQLFQGAVEIAKAKQACCVVIDDRKASIAAPEDHDWVIRELMPRAHQSGIRFCAVVLPTREVVARNQMVRSLAKAQDQHPRPGGVEIRTVDSLEQAWDWVDSKLG